MTSTRSTSNKLRIAICDDHQLLREGLRRIINATDDMEVAMEFPDGHSLHKGLADNPVDVVILDISLPGHSGIEVLGGLRTHFSSTPVLILSMYPEEELAPRALKSGAYGYLHKDSAPDHLITAIHTVYNGNYYISDYVADKIANQTDGEDEQSDIHKLSAREYEVMLAMGKGYPTKEIGSLLGISIKTVSTYRTRVLQKLHLKNNAELISYMHRHKLFSEDI